MKKINLLLTLLFTVIISANLSAQEKQIREVSGFSIIDVAEGIKVTLTMGDKERVEVIAPADYIDNVVTEVDGDELNIHIKGHNNGNKGRNVEVNVTAIKIKGIDVSSGASVKTTNAIKAEFLSVSVSSGANAKVEFNAEKASADASSGASCTLRGAANYFKADASSGSHITANDVKAQHVKADVSSGAGIKVHAEKEIKADASSGGSVSYSGSPEMVDVEKSSGGSVRKN
ncbi:MAG: DUF2807 domain-containing protein [Proteobacteria bacterium]|nr:DUF2807 domain-containing protein [Pseudomonadota bacterium]